jgi:hypothetical protein
MVLSRFIALELETSAEIAAPAHPAEIMLSPTAAMPASPPIGAMPAIPAAPPPMSVR